MKAFRGKKLRNDWATAARVRKPSTGNEMEPINPATFIAALRESGQPEAAEGAEIMNEVEAAAAPVPFQRPGASPDAEAIPRTNIVSGTDPAGAERASVGRSPASSGQQAALAAEAGHADSGDSVPSSGRASPVSADEPVQAPDHASDHEPDHEHATVLAGTATGADHGVPTIDAADPLAGLRSFRLRDALEREAFGSVSSVAQDSAIVERADSFARGFKERAESFGPDSLSIDISRAAQDARIAVLNGEIPAFARGNPELDPAMIRALDRSTSQEPGRTLATERGQAPIESAASASAQSSTVSRMRNRDAGMER
jgi:hypothetical protein